MNFGHYNLTNQMNLFVEMILCIKLKLNLCIFSIVSKAMICASQGVESCMSRHESRVSYSAAGHAYYRDLHGDGDAGIPGNPRKFLWDEANVAGFPWGWKQMSRDSRGDGTKLYGIPTGK